MAVYRLKFREAKPKDQRIKIQVILASIMIVVTGSLAIYEYTAFAARKDAYETLVKASQLQNNQEVLKASTTFLEKHSFLKKDERTSQVIELYQNALVRWLPQQPGEELSPQEKKYIDLMKKLQQSRSEKGN
ncbi:hypothetical protein [Calothrix sp. CCY 0018]|uniref:hypothetical protein n=1 Tax=Calothrix sp. CCY 0018 TaxID=3103864 RepID=UPI0039C62E0B